MIMWALIKGRRAERKNRSLVMVVLCGFGGLIDICVESGSEYWYCGT